MLSLRDQPHRRLNPLTGDWVLVSPRRTQRPWLGQVEKVAPEIPSAYDPSCYLCPGNARAGGTRNPQYTSTFVFDNDFAALLPNTPREQQNERGLLVAQGEPGVCRVICFSPRHDLTLARMSHAEIREVVDIWGAQYLELAACPGISYVQVFENRGAMMGTSNPHPHCQLWATANVPNEPAKEQRCMRSYASEKSACLLCDYMALEAQRERVIFDDEHFMIVVPFWAIWPFEILIISKRHVADMAALAAAERDALARILQRITAIYGQVFDAPFPYTMGFHQRPTKEEHPEWHLHAHFYPPLLRSATIRKFMVGFEMLGSPQRDITPEDAAARLREVARSVLESAGA